MSAGCPHRRVERGLATPLTVALTGVLLVATLVGAAWGRLLVDQRRAAAAADFAALAGAAAVQTGRAACPAALDSSRANGAELLRCDVAGERVRVRTGIRSPSLLGRLVRVEATGHAGPVESRAGR